jgi:hypothetical protein
LDTIETGTLTELSKETFSGAESIRSIDLSGLGSIPQQCFYNCSALEEVKLADTVAFVGAEAFYGCKALRAINLSGVKSVGERAFYECKQLESVAENASSIGHSAFSYTNIKQVSLPNLTHLSSGVFKGSALKRFVSTKLKTVDLGSGANGGPFEQTSTSYIDLSTVEEITGVGRLGSQIQDVSVIIRNSNPLTLPHAGVLLTGTELITRCQVYVPDNAVEAYKTAAIWAEYTLNIHPLSELTQEQQ